MAFPVTLNGRTYTLADFSGTNYVEGFPAALEDFVTQAGNIYTTTSTSSVAIGTGSKTFTVADSGKPYTVGTPLRIADAAAPATNWIDGIVTSYSGTTLVVNAIAYAGSGTIASWNINIGGSAIAYTGTLPVAQGGTGATTAADARTNLDTYSKAEADSRFLNVSGEASNVTMTGDVTIGDAGTDTLTVNATATMADTTLTTADINGGTIDGTVIGGSTPAAISGTTGSFSGNLTVDTNTLFVDATNNRVGIGTTSPAANLDVNGSIQASGRAFFAGSQNVGTMLTATGSLGGAEFYSSGVSDAAFMSFHRPGAYGAYFGLDTDNTFAVGGWSAGAGLAGFKCGALSKASGSFKIDHPLKPDTHYLVHSFIEGPQADNIYRGRVTLVDGSAVVDIDAVAGMTEGTFVALNRDIQCFTSNETGWCNVRGSVAGNILTIEAQDNTCTDTISWLVIGERHDQHMYDTNWTDENAKVIVEPEKTSTANTPE